MTEDIRAHFRSQADACERLGSPFTALLARIAADVLDVYTQVGGTVLNWPGQARDDAVALRFLGALHALVLAGADRELAALYPPHAADPEGLRHLMPAVLERHADRIIRSLASPPQTNEVARAAMLLPGLLAVARRTDLPLALFEIGASAGLNLNLDRFHHAYGNAAWGDSGAAVRLAPEVRAAPPLDGRLEIAARRGCDISPVDLADPEARLRLRSYVWPDQALRRQRIDAAIELALNRPVVVEKAEALDFIRRHAAQPIPGVARTLVHSIMWQYMPQSTRHAIEAEMAAIGKGASEQSPLAWLRMEPLDTAQPHALLTLTLWPSGETLELARCDYHGRWIDWTGHRTPA
ncbi:MAG: DUF2332 family protein [Rhizobiaceae bacterium]|nr:DUF2332 family protein [Rhizobiaceae bacterium]